jgi:hypothetical protein
LQRTILSQADFYEAQHQKVVPPVHLSLVVGGRRR